MNNCINDVELCIAVAALKSERMSHSQLLNLMRSSVNVSVNMPAELSSSMSVKPPAGTPVKPPAGTPVKPPAGMSESTTQFYVRRDAAKYITKYITRDIMDSGGDIIMDSWEG